MPSPTTSASPGLLGSLADLLDPPHHDVLAELRFQPNCAVRQAAAVAAGFGVVVDALDAGIELPPPCGECPQERFLAGFDEPNTDTLYGGAAGGGKSSSLLVGALRAADRFDGLQAFWFRRTFPELEQSVLRMLARFAFGKAIGCAWNGSRHELTFPNGSILTFAHAKNMQEATALQSAEIQLLILDERTTIPPDVVDMLYTRVRSGVAGLPVLGVRSATNPGNIGHARVKSEYIEATDHGEKAITDAAGRRRSFIQAKVSDTPQVGAEYLKALDGIPDPALRKAMRDGDWDVFAGQVFSEWRYGRHVMEPITIPAEWRRVGGIDWGHRAPSAVEFVAVDPDGRAWVYDEVYAPQLGEKGLAEAILAKGGAANVFAIDPATANKVGDAQPVASQLVQAGVRVQLGNNDRLSGWARVHTYLAEAPACEHHRALGWETCPLLHVFANCADLIRTLPALVYNSTGRLEDVDTDGEDHGPDALRYCLVGLGTTSRPVLYTDEELAAHAVALARQAAELPAPQPLLGGTGFAGDTSTGLGTAKSDNGRVAKSPFA